MNTKKVVKDIPERKINSVKVLKNLIKSKATILIASIKDLPASQFQEIGKKLRGKAIVKVPKKNLIFRAIDESGTKEFEKLKDQIKADSAILFSDLDSFDLAGELLKSKIPAKAKPGQIAPYDIEVSEGPTDLVPGPAISELGALGIEIKIEKGKINIAKSKVIVKEGAKISQKASDLMAKLDIKPFSIGFTPLSSFDTKEGKFYMNIKINPEEAVANLKSAYGKALPFAVNVGYASKDTIKHLLGKANAHGTKVNRIWTGEPEPVAEAVVVKEEVKQKVKGEPKADAGAGLASLFG
ncbi:50S ribosomal protein L10 [Candidatus Pacearchaeota archaeon]|nr:50S ribosomal protein L10 [Candidatus Pacearchaeota archaeon]